MDNAFTNSNNIVNSGIYKNLKCENERLSSQNHKLIKKLEEITWEFSKSQIKLKHIESKDGNQINISGNLSTLLDQIKSLESDNRKLCEELHKNMNFDKMQDSISRELDQSNAKQLSDIQSLKSNSREKIINLKNHIQELQKQLVKTQQIAFDNECNYKECQIETLESLKFCEIEKKNLSNKILDLEEKAKNMLLLHQENLELKTTLNRCSSEIKSVKNQCLKLTDKIGKSEQSKKELEQSMKCLANNLELSQKKVDELNSENQCLQSTMQQLVTVSDRIDPDQCEKCIEKMSLTASVQEELRKMSIDLANCNKEKEEINNQYHEQTTIIVQFEEEQKKLRTELNNLAKDGAKYESLFKSKEDQIENLNCQLSSVQQRLELRDHRVAEISNQFNKSVLEEKHLTVKISKLSEKIRILEEDQISSQEEIVQTKKENLILLGKVEQYQTLSSKNDQTIGELRTHLSETEMSNIELKGNIENMKSFQNSKTQEVSLKTTSLNKIIEQLNYSINIYENQNKKLEENLQSIREEYETLKNSAQRDTESHRLELDRTQVQLKKDQEIIEQHQSDIQNRLLEIEELKTNKCDLEREHSEKNKEMELSACQYQLVLKQLTDTKSELDSLTNLNHQLQQDSLSNQQLKIELNDRIKENKKLTHNQSELNLRLDVLNRSFLEEKKKLKTEESRCRDMAGQLEAIQFKFAFVDEELGRNRQCSKELEENLKSELKRNLDKLSSIENERDEILAKNLVFENTNNNTKKECQKYQGQINELQKVVSSQKEELLSQNQFVQQLQREIYTLQELVKCSQVTLVERSRDIDRLEQLVRDRSEQIELRSSQLQEFQVDLEMKLKEMQSEVEEANKNADQCKAESDKNKKSYDELTCKFNDNDTALKEMISLNKDKEEDVASVIRRSKQLESENQSLAQNIRLLKEELASKVLVVKDLLQQIRRKDKELDNVAEKLESTVSALGAKELLIKQTDEQAKKNRQSFTEIEAKLKTELKSTVRKLESLEADVRKSSDKLEKKHKQECDRNRDQLSIETANVERLKQEWEMISKTLFESEEKLANLKIEMQTLKSVMIDTENNCRLKGVVIERLLKKLNMNSLKMYGDQINDDTKSKGLNNESSYVDIYEDVSLQELIKRITKKLEYE